MKYLTISGCILLCIISIQVNGQNTPPLHQTLPVKPSLFSQLPDKFSISINVVEKLFTASSAGIIKIAAADDITFDGVILEKVERSPRITTINIKILNYDGALFTISKITGNESVTYSGRLLNINYGDALVVSKENNKLYLTKEKQTLFLVE